MDRVDPSAIRAAFAAAMSQMYAQEVPLYAALTGLTAEVNAGVLAADPALASRLRASRDQLQVERHGAIRLGTAEELTVIARAFAVMGMHPVDYYDLAPAGVPVHSTAFRAIDAESLARSPFRMFTSLLRLDLIPDPDLRADASAILARRRIVNPLALGLIARAEGQGGLDAADASRFVAALTETFRWHSSATVSAADYRRLSAAHRLIADIVSFRGPHINHLTPRTLDIDAVQAGMAARGMVPKDRIEGPPARACPVLLRQTSFKALDEPIAFMDGAGSHTARFGEVEQRGVALTPKGQAIYDRWLAEGGGLALPDDWEALRRQGLGYFRYTARGEAAPGDDIETAIARGAVVAEPIVYEDFLPVSAAGIFQSNLGTAERSDYAAHADRAAFEAALGQPIIDRFALYATIEADSLAAVGATSGLSRGVSLPI